MVNNARGALLSAAQQWKLKLLFIIVREIKGRTLLRLQSWEGGEKWPDNQARNYLFPETRRIRDEIRENDIWCIFKLFTQKEI